MSSGQLGMKWFCYMGMDRYSNLGDWIFARFRHSTPHSVVVSVTPRRRSCSRPAAGRLSCCCPQIACLSGVATGALGSYLVLGGCSRRLALAHRTCQRNRLIRSRPASCALSGGKSALMHHCTYTDMSVVPQISSSASAYMSSC